MTLEIGLAALNGLLLVAWLALGARRRRRPVAQPLPRPPEPVFRRPGELGPLLRPFEEVQRVRAGVFLDQLVPGDDLVAVDMAGWPEGPRLPGRTPARVGLAPYVPSGDDGEEDPRERACYWMAHWQDDVLALTGRGVA